MKNKWIIHSAMKIAEMNSSAHKKQVKMDFSNI